MFPYFRNFVIVTDTGRASTKTNKNMNSAYFINKGYEKSKKNIYQSKVIEETDINKDKINRELQENKKTPEKVHQFKLDYKHEIKNEFFIGVISNSADNKYGHRAGLPRIITESLLITWDGAKITNHKEQEKIIGKIYSYISMFESIITSGERDFEKASEGWYYIDEFSEWIKDFQVIFNEISKGRKKDIDRNHENVSQLFKGTEKPNYDAANLDEFNAFKKQLDVLFGVIFDLSGEEKKTIEGPHRNELDELIKSIKSKENELKQNQNNIDDTLNEAKVYSGKGKYHEFIEIENKMESLFNQHERIQGVPFDRKEYYRTEFEKLKETASTKFKQMESLHKNAHQLLMGGKKLEYDAVSLTKLKKFYQKVNDIFDDISVLSQNKTETIEQQYRETLDELRQSIKSKENEINILFDQYEKIKGIAFDGKEKYFKEIGNFKSLIDEIENDFTILNRLVNSADLKRFKEIKESLTGSIKQLSKLLGRVYELKTEDLNKINALEQNLNDHQGKITYDNMVTKINEARSNNAEKFNNMSKDIISMIECRTNRSFLKICPKYNYLHLLFSFFIGISVALLSYYGYPGIVKFINTQTASKTEEQATDSNSVTNSETPSNSKPIKSTEIVPLAISHTTNKMIVGNTLQLNATDGNPPYSWLSSDKTIASVDKTGLVSANLAGTVTITLTGEIASVNFTLTIIKE